MPQSLTLDEHRALSRVKNGLVIDEEMQRALMSKGMVVQLLGGLGLTLQGKMIVKPLR